MEDNEKKLQFVLKHYQHGLLDTEKALQRLKLRQGIKPRRIALRRWVAAAAVLVIVGLAALWQLYPRTTTIEAGNTVRVYALADGSRATLAPHATLSYRGKDMRHIDVSGKVYMEVKHDEGNPFTIADDDYLITDIGTAFEVDEQEQSTKVTVTEGEVLFAAASQPTKGLSLRQGMCAVLAKGSNQPRLMPVASTNHVAWATHRFHFDDTPIDHVLQELSAYYGVTLTTKGTDKRLSGDFDADSLPRITGIIEQTLNITIHQQ